MRASVARHQVVHQLGCDQSRQALEPVQSRGRVMGEAHAEVRPENAFRHVSHQLI
jgi:hypothetical protein